MCAGYLMSEFTKFWFNEKPKDIMEFSRIRDKFQRHIVSLLKDSTTVLIADFQGQWQWYVTFSISSEGLTPSWRTASNNSDSDASRFHWLVKIHLQSEGQLLTTITSFFHLPVKVHLRPEGQLAATSTEEATLFHLLMNNNDIILSSFYPEGQLATTLTEEASLFNWLLKIHLHPEGPPPSRRTACSNIDRRSITFSLAFEDLPPPLKANFWQHWQLIHH